MEKAIRIENSFEKTVVYTKKRVLTFLANLLNAARYPFSGLWTCTSSGPGEYSVPWSRISVDVWCTSGSTLQAIGRM